MKRAPKQPKRVRSVMRAAAREQGSGLYVAQAGNRPAVLLNIGDHGPLVPGAPTILAKGRSWAKKRGPTPEQVGEVAERMRATLEGIVDAIPSPPHVGEPPEAAP